jgi:hypothetical protein
MKDKLQCAHCEFSRHQGKLRIVVFGAFKGGRVGGLPGRQSVAIRSGCPSPPQSRGQNPRHLFLPAPQQDFLLYRFPGAGLRSPTPETFQSTMTLSRMQFGVIYFTIPSGAMSSHSRHLQAIRSVRRSPAAMVCSSHARGALPVRKPRSSPIRWCSQGSNLPFSHGAPAAA